MKSHARRSFLRLPVVFLSVVGLLTTVACERQVEERAPVVRPVRILTIGDGNIGAALSRVIFGK